MLCPTHVFRPGPPGLTINVTVWPERDLAPMVDLSSGTTAHGSFDVFLKLFFTHLSGHPPTRAVSCALLSSRACRMLTGACNLMLCAVQALV